MMEDQKSGDEKVTGMFDGELAVEGGDVAEEPSGR